MPNSSEIKPVRSYGSSQEVFTVLPLWGCESQPHMMWAHCGYTQNQVINLAQKISLFCCVRREMTFSGVLAAAMPNIPKLLAAVASCTPSQNILSKYSSVSLFCFLLAIQPNECGIRRAGRAIFYRGIPGQFASCVWPFTLRREIRPAAGNFIFNGSFQDAKHCQMSGRGGETKRWVELEKPC